MREQIIWLAASRVHGEYDLQHRYQCSVTSGELKTEEDAIVVLKTATIYFRRAHFPRRSFSEKSMSAASPPSGKRTLRLQNAWRGCRTPH